jgi:hypothetical protein
VSLWSWLAVGLGAWTVFGLFSAIGMARALRFGSDLPPADRPNEPDARTPASEIARAIEDKQEQYARPATSSLGAPHASSSAIGD